jgi:hypothetical protein
MNENNQPPPEDGASTHFQQVDPILAGDAVLARAKSVAQQISERVRRLTEGMQRDHSGDTTDGTCPNAS